MGLSTPNDDSRRPWLRRADQATVAAILLLALAAMAAHVVWRAKQHGRLIDIDRAARQRVDFKVDLNTASWAELTLLPGVGETLARRIVESRETEGPFIDHADLQRVRGIGPRTLERLQPFLLPLAPADNLAGEGGRPGES